MKKLSPLLSILIIIATITGLFLFVFILIGSIKYFSSDISPKITYSPVNEKLWTLGVFLAVISGTLYFLEIFINGLISAIKHLDIWSKQRKLKRGIKNV